MSENDTDCMWPCFAFLFAFDQHLYFPIVLLLFRHLFFKSQSLCVLFYLLFETVFVNCPASSFSLLPFAFLPSFFGPYIFLFTPLPGDHRTRGPEHYTTTGPEPQDQRTRGPQDQRSLNFFSRGCKHFFPGNVIFFPGIVIFFPVSSRWYIV